MVQLACMQTLPLPTSSLLLKCNLHFLTVEISTISVKLKWFYLLKSTLMLQGINTSALILYFFINAA